LETSADVNFADGDAIEGAAESGLVHPAAIIAKSARQNKNR
jgi:hypothetical protein